MPRFFLHLRCQRELIPDEEGSDLPDLAAAEREAVRGARSIMSAEVKEGRLCLDQAIAVHDEDERWLSDVRFGDALEIVTGDQESG